MSRRASRGAAHNRLETPTPEPEAIPEPPKPVLVLPDPPRGLASLFGKAKHAKFVENAQRDYAQALAVWEAQCKDVEQRRQNAKDLHAQSEAQRLEKLTSERARYAKECEARVAAVTEQNRKLDELIANLGYGTTEAIQEYISVVLSNSVYPDHFLVTHEFEFDAATAELRLCVTVPGPDKLPTVKAYKYTKSSDEISSTALSQKQCRDRYASAVHQVALRSLHEVFEADRRGLIKTITLEVGTHAIDPATGLNADIPFVIVAAEREAFLAFNLAAVVPAQTLSRLGASVSKNPYELVPAERGGIRRA